MRFSSSVLRSVLALVTKAREEGHLQSWKKPQLNISEHRKGRFSYASPIFQVDPKLLFAPEIAQNFAESTLEALHLGSSKIALLRAKRAAEVEEKYSRPGVYRDLFLKVAELVEPPLELIASYEPGP